MIAVCGDLFMKSNNEYFRVLSNKLEASLNKGSLKPSEWITKHTYLYGKNFSFKGHEFQQEVIDCSSRQAVVQKCCQVGFTESYSRLALESVANRGLNTIFTQPDFNMSKGFSKSRINPIVESSPKLKSLIRDSNSVDMKQFGDAFLYVKYTKGAESLALSTPADVLLCDELDHSDPKNVKLFRSRLEHSKYRIERFFGTPTIPKKGISEMIKTTEKKYYMVKCPSCGKWNKTGVHNLINFPHDIFSQNEPDFPVVYKELLYSVEDKVYIGCMHCGASLEDTSKLLIPTASNKPASGSPVRAWVAENSGTIDDNTAIGFLLDQIGSGLKTGRMIVQSMRGYEDMRDIYNQILGLPFASSVDSLVDEDLIFTNDYNIEPPFTFIGLDFGKTSSLLVLYVDFNTNELMVVDTYELPLVTLENDDAIIDSVGDIVKKYGAVCLAMDAMPYPNTVSKLKKRLPIPSIDVYLADKYEKVMFDGREMRYKYNRTASIDAMLSDFKTGKTRFSGNCLRMKSKLVSQFKNFIKDKNRYGDYYYPKLSGDDHFGFAYMYAKIAYFCLENFDNSFSFEPDTSVPFLFGNTTMKY
jgi:predicted nucleic-acid-binding Zn-ribbon protein